MANPNVYGAPGVPQPGPAPLPPRGILEAPPNPEIFVRRLYKPKLYDQAVANSGMLSQVASLSRHLNSSDQLTVKPAAREVPQCDFLLQNSMQLPEEFGRIYLGETFAAYISVVNQLPFPIILIDAVATLKNSRGIEVSLNNVSGGPGMISLGITKANPRELQPGDNLDVVVEHVLQELDWHYLAIKLEFVDSRTRESRPMMKRFKFKVYNPVAITNINRLINQQVFIQAQIKNITERVTSLVLEEVAFIPEDGFTVEDVSQSHHHGDEDLDGEDNDAAYDCLRAFDRHVQLQPDEVAQFLFVLRRSDTYKGKTLSLIGGVPLGQLRVSWRTTLGESGSLLSPRVTCTGDANNAIRHVEVVMEEDLPEALVQGHVYTVRCSLVNNTDKDLKLQVQFHLESMQGVYVNGRSFQNVGLVPARSKKPVTIQLLPLMAGLHEVKGLSIVDLVTAQEYAQNKLCEVLVVRKEGD